MASYIPGVTDFVPDIQPFQPDWGTIDKTMRIKQGRYDQNYSAIQSSYSGLLNMPQLKQSQIDKRDKFMKSAFKSIGDLSSVDLSLPENAASAQNVFAPLYNDTEFLGNASMSKHYNAQEEYADQLRQKDGGKEFSMDNLNYVRMQKQEYIQDENPDSWKKYHANKKYYESYYDYSKEYRDAMAQYKPSSVAMTRMNGMYFVKTEDKSWKEADIKKYLNATLSEKAKRQMQIEGVVRLGSSPEAIVNEYKSVGQKQITDFQDKIEDIDQALKETKDPTQLKQLHQLRSQIADNLQETQTHLSKASENDYEYVKNNRENLAFQIYYDKLVGKVAAGYAHEDTKLDITENSVAFGMWKDSQEWGRMNARFNHDYKMEALKAHNDREAAKLVKKKEDDEANPQGVAVGIPSVGEDAQVRGLGDVTSAIESIKGQKFQLSEDLRRHVAEVTGVDQKKAHLLKWDRVKRYLDSPQGKRDDYIRSAYTPQMNRLTLMEDGKQHEINKAETYATQGLKPAELQAMKNIKANINKIGSVTIGKGPNAVGFSSNEVFEAIYSGKEMKRTAPDRTGSVRISFSINGKQVSGDIAGPNADPQIMKFAQMYNKVANSMVSKDKVLGIWSKDAMGIEAYDKFNKKVVDYFKTERTTTRRGLTYNDESKPVKQTKGYLASILPNTGVEKITGLTYDYAGNRVYFGMKSTETDPLDIEGTLNTLKSKGIKAGYNEASQSFYMEGTGIPGTDALQNLSPNERELVEIGHSAQAGYESPFYYPVGPTDASGKPMKPFRFVKTNTSGGDPVYYLYADGVKDPVRQRRYTDLPSLLLDARNLSLNPAAAAALLK